jgi:hypothetical protein
MVPPPWVVRLRVRSIGLLSIIVDSIHLFHLGKYRHRWTILWLVHRTSTARTTLDSECVGSTDGPIDVESVKSLGERIYL